MTVTVVVPSIPVLSVTRFIAFGDSITLGEDGQNLTSESVMRSHPLVVFPDFQTYPGALKQQLAARYSTQTITVVPDGYAGESVTATGTLEPAPTRFARDITGGQYDVVLIMEGANDLLVTRDSLVEPAVISGLRQMILTAKGRSIQPFLATIPPEQDGCCPTNRGLGSSLVPGFNDLVRALADEQKVPLVDVYAALSDNVNTYIGPDGLHPTAAGYAQIADTFFRKIKETLEIQPTLAPAVVGSHIRPGASAVTGRGVQTASPVRRPTPRKP